MNKYLFPSRFCLAVAGEGASGGAVTPPPASTPDAVTPPLEVQPPTNPSLIGEAPLAPKPPEGTAPEGTPPEPPAPPAELAAITDETFATVLPEGFEVVDEQKTALLEAINSGTSRAEIAKNLLGLYQTEVQKFQEAQVGVWDRVQESWQAEIKAAPEFAGDKLAPALAQAKEIAFQLGGDEFVQMLDLTGSGNNIHVLRALLKARELIPQEGVPVTGNPTTAPKSLADKLFDNTPKAKGK